MKREQPDKRKKKRLPLQVLVSYLDQTQSVDNFSVNMSSEGIFIATRTPLPKDVTVKLTFQIPLSKPSLILEGKVIWIRTGTETKGQIPGMGIKFHTLTEDEKQELKTLMEQIDQAS